MRRNEGVRILIGCVSVADPDPNPEPMRMYLALLDPDPDTLDRGKDPDSSIFKQK